jgi:hypothetical protein
MSPRWGIGLAAALVTGAMATAMAQQAAAPAQAAATSSGPIDTTCWTTADDHNNMKMQLGITQLRPGPSGTETAPNHANYDEATANPYPRLPDPLILKNGKKVTSANSWNKERRPEIVEDFDREVLGRVPKNVPKVKWEVVETANGMVGDQPTIGKRLLGHVDNSAYPGITVDIQMSVVTPANAKGPVPVMMMFGGGGNIPGGTQPAGRGGFGGAAPNTNCPAVAGGPGGGGARGAGGRGAQVAGAARAGAPAAGGTAGPAGQASRGTPPPAPVAAAPAAPAAARPPQDLPATQQLLAAGWGYVQINPTSIQADQGSGLTKGIIGLTNKGQPRKPDDWGSLRAWAWGAARGLDYLETDKAVDAKKVGIEGVSRYGKAALVTMAYDQRFAVVLIGSSGEGGAKLHRRNWGEAVENLTGSGEYHWMAGNFLKYGTAESSFGSKNPGDLPVDAHELLALCAPRLTFISYGVPEKGDAKWLDHQGSFMAAIAAQPVFRLLGAKDLGRSDDYTKEKMPDVNVAMMDGQLAWRQHDGGHTDGPNWKYFIPWASKNLKYTPK